MFRHIIFCSILLLLTSFYGHTNLVETKPSKNLIFSTEYQSVHLENLNSIKALTEKCKQFLDELNSKKFLAEQSALAPSLTSFYTPFDSMSVSLKNFSERLRLISDSFENQKLRQTARACNQKILSFEHDIYLSKNIYSNILKINNESLDQETQYSLTKQIKKFQQSGINLDNNTRKKLHAIKNELVEIEQEFNKNINERVNFITAKPEELKGLPADYLNARPPDANGYIKISTRYPDLIPVISYAHNDNVRKRLWFKFWQRAYPENVPVVDKLLKKRYEYARLLGYKNYADLIISDKMAKSPIKVENFLHKLNQNTKEADKNDYNRLLARLKAINPSARKVELWQRDYLYELVLKEQFNVDSQTIQKYFSFAKTQAGLFKLIEDLFNIEIRDWNTWVWDKAVTAHEIYDKNKLLGRFYLDLHPRKGKFNHAKVITLQQGIQNKQIPIAAMLANFPAGDTPLSHNDVITYLHEFGHVIHVMFSNRKYSNTAGVTTERDFIEAPSQMLEEWAWHYPTLLRFATNDKGEVLPKEIFDSMKAARNFNMGMNTRQQLHYAAFSLEVYKQNPNGLDVDKLSDDLQSVYTLFPANKNQYLYTSFTHLNGYSATYYSYQWSLAIATDLLSKFRINGMMDSKTATNYRKKILAQGGSKPANLLVENFLGRPVSFASYAEKLKSYINEN